MTFFKVKVLLENPDRRLRPGMSVRAEIETATHDDVPVVPIQAVVQRPPVRADVETEPARVHGDLEDEVSVVLVVEDGEAVQRQVVTGISDTTHVEILSGVAVGERAVVGPYRTLRDLEHGEAVEVGTPGEDEEGDEEDDGERS